MSTTFQGSLFDNATLAATPATFEIAGERLRALAPGPALDVPLADVRVSDRLAEVPRYLYLPDQRTIETPDNAALDLWLSGQGRGRLVSLIHGLERHSRVAAIATVLIVGSVALGLGWGLPYLARQAALAVPEKIEQQAGRVAQAGFNRLVAPSRASAADRRRVQAQLDRLLKAAGIEQSAQVVFCSMAGTGPNAFALPGGIIVMSDELIALAGQRDEELAAVLAHEIGHWQHRHGLQSVLRNSTALLVVSVVTGDLSTLTTFAGTLPFILLQTGYSREFEREADLYAHELLKRTGIPSWHLADILDKLDQAQPPTGPNFTYLSTHPSTQERVQALKLTGPRPATPPASPTPAATPDEEDFSEAVTLDKADVMPKALHRVAPQYPAALRAAGVSGEVTIEFIIDRQGDVRNVRVVRSSHVEFEAPAVAAISQWRFTPGSRKGRVVATRASQHLEFNVNE